MTDAQKDAVNKAHEILGEHFDSHVVLVAHTNDNSHEIANTTHGGGFYAALGLLTRAQVSYAYSNIMDADEQQE